MRAIRDARELSEAAGWLGRKSGLGGVLVPTMGALHRGHIALVERAAAMAGGGPCVVSIFVNPTQFNEKADFDRYPRTPKMDMDMCREAGATLVFAPDAETMYPTPEAAPVPPLPAVAAQPGLEDGFRPGHFAGVCQVVLRLFRLLEPATAVFGEKDWQQLQVITAMTRQEGLGIRIVPHPTIRDPDGLAMSSRNRFLSEEERHAALAIPRALAAAGAAPDPAAAERAMREELERSTLQVEYAVVRDATTLVGPPGRDGGRALIAARSGRTRLIDNAPWPATAGSSPR
jgi:pantoate--beta-alanine ligase